MNGYRVEFVSEPLLNDAEPLPAEFEALKAQIIERLEAEVRRVLMAGSEVCRTERASRNSGGVVTDGN